jgi:DNA helicase-2/ATP-dependent DNA helicase PcrA
MAERVEHLAGGFSVSKPWVSTFHSFCVRALRRDIEAMRIGNSGYTKDFAIYDDSDQQQIVKGALRRLGVDDKQFTPRNILGRISWAKNHMLDPQEVYLQSGDPKTEKIAHVYEIYRQELRKANALDFDDLLLETVRLLKSIEPVRKKYQNRFQYLLVDEYQDTNRPQYEMIKLLAGEHHNICAVGDEDQSIYSWRGADIRNILEFERDFPEAKIIRLEQNYRSTQPILQGASAVVANNVKRKGKNLWTDREGGSKIGYYEAPDGENEALFVADYMNRYLDNQRREGKPDTKVAVLYRTNSQSRLFEEAMRRYGLNYSVVGGFSFYERAEIKDMISYLKLVQNPDDSIAFMRVINTPARGIGKTTMDTLERLAVETGSSLWTAMNRAIEGMLLPPRALVAFKNFRDIIFGAQAILTGTFQKWLGDGEDESTAEVEERFEAPATTPEVEEGENISFDFGANAEDDFNFGANADDVEGAKPAAEVPPAQSSYVADILKFLIDRTGYIKVLEEEDSPEALARIENLRELVNAAMDSKDRGETMQEFLDHAALVSDTDQFDAKSQVTLMTLHSAKGLEFPLVFLVGMEEGLFPHSRTFLNPDEIEEERRLCYVGMTRAMDTLVLSWARYRRRYGTDMPEASVPSRFLEEVPPQLIEDIANPGRARGRAVGNQRSEYDGDRHYDYENEDQRPQYGRKQEPAKTYGKTASVAGKYNSIDNIAEFFASRGKKFNAPKVQVEEPTGKRGFRPGQRVKHPKYGEGTVYKREGDGEDAKITVQFPRFGLKKLVEKYAQLEKA